MEWGCVELRWLYQYVQLYGKKWKFICKNFYQDRFAPEALLYQYNFGDKIYKAMIEYSTLIMFSPFEVCEKSAFMYAL